MLGKRQNCTIGGRASGGARAGLPGGRRGRKWPPAAHSLRRRLTRPCSAPQASCQQQRGRGPPQPPPSTPSQTPANIGIGGEPVSGAGVAHRQSAIELRQRGSSELLERHTQLAPCRPCRALLHLGGTLEALGCLAQRLAKLGQLAGAWSGGRSGSGQWGGGRQELTVARLIQRLNLTSPNIRAATPAITASSGTPRPNRPMRVTCRRGARACRLSRVICILPPHENALLLLGARREARFADIGRACTVHCISAVDGVFGQI